MITVRSGPVLRSILMVPALWRDILPDAPVCEYRWSRATGGTNRHPWAPAGASHCPRCNRMVFRGNGRWWER